MNHDIRKSDRLGAVRREVEGGEFDDLLHPARAFARPSDVVDDPGRTLDEKRAILASWASDACAARVNPALRLTADGETARWDDIMDALKELDRRETKSAPTHSDSDVFCKLRRGLQTGSGNGPEHGSRPARASAMMETARVLPLAAQVEARKRRRHATSANDNDPPDPPPAAASRIPPSHDLDERDDMEHYDFAVLKGDETITVLKSIALPDLKAAWSLVTDLAQSIDEPEGHIRVTNGAGEVEILAGLLIVRGDLAGALAGSAMIPASDRPSSQSDRSGKGNRREQPIRCTTPRNTIGLSISGSRSDGRPLIQVKETAARRLLLR